MTRSWCRHCSLNCAQVFGRVARNLSSVFEYCAMPFASIFAAPGAAVGAFGMIGAGGFPECWKPPRWFDPLRSFQFSRLFNSAPLEFTVRSPGRR